MMKKQFSQGKDLLNQQVLDFKSSSSIRVFVNRY